MFLIKLNAHVKKQCGISPPIILYRRKCCNRLDKKIFSWYAIATEQIKAMCGMHVAENSVEVSVLLF